MKTRLLLLILVLTTGVAQAQYYHEQVLEKSFEEMDFFFQPSLVNPYGIGGFGAVATGLIDDPLLNLRLNPASLAGETIGTQYLLLNFRSSHEITESNLYYPTYGGGYGLDAVDVYYPSYYVNSRKELEPVFSMAALFQPLKDTPGLTLGFDYEAILQDEAYYEIPQDIYRSQVGSDFSGAELAAPSDVPIVDRYSGEDRIHHEGHFFNLMAAVPLGGSVALGVRSGRVFFDRDGAYGSRNYWEHSYNQSSSSTWYNMTGREQEYDHWDTAVGLNVDLSESVRLGLSGGCLSGDATQTRYRESRSDYEYGAIGVGDDWSVYDQDSTTDQSWRHDGRNVYGGLNFTARLNSKQTVNLYYKYSDEEVDLTLGSSLADTSSGNYQHVYDTNEYGSESTSSLVDLRSGEGIRHSESHQAAVSLQWQVGDKTRVNLGANLSRRHRATRTREAVNADRYSDYEWTHNTETDNHYYSVEERKDLYWDFESSETAFHLPVMVFHRISPAIELQFGLKRTMRRWTINDVTVAIFEYRTENWNGEIDHQENYGERYTQPEEKRSEVKTTMLAGMTVNPTEHLEMRFLVVPNFEKTWDGSELSDLQWWIDFRLY